MARGGHVMLGYVMLCYEIHIKLIARHLIHSHMQKSLLNACH